MARQPDPDINAESSTFSVSNSLLMLGVVGIVLADAVSGTALSVARLNIAGSTFSTLDESAKLDYGYAAIKIVAFLVAPWLCRSIGLGPSVLYAGAMLTAASFLAAFANDIEIMFLLRLLQGFGGGIVLVGSQGLVFRGFAKNLQPLVQGIFAISSAVAPAALVPSLQGWLIDTYDWPSIFLASVPLGIAGMVALALSRNGDRDIGSAQELDIGGTLILVFAAFCIVFALNQGNRYDWLEDQDIVRTTAVGVTATVWFVIRHFRGSGRATLVDVAVFRNANFDFGLGASLVAGFALLGTGFVIPAFATSVLKMTPTAAGSLLLPSALTFSAALFLTALIIQKLKLPGIITVPLGIIGFMVAMWQLSGSTSGSGIPDLTSAVLLRGAALGFMFLSVTLVTLASLEPSLVLQGIALFNVFRQMGGLVGISFLQTFVEDQTSFNQMVLVAHAVPGKAEFSQRVRDLTLMLSSHGVESNSAAKAAVSLIGRQIALEANTIAFNTAFFSITLFFLVAAPCLILWKVLSAKLVARTTAGEGL